MTWVTPERWIPDIYDDRVPGSYYHIFAPHSAWSHIRTEVATSGRFLLEPVRLDLLYTRMRGRLCRGYEIRPERGESTERLAEWERMEVWPSVWVVYWEFEL
jgi:hypothetical protein